LSPDPTGLGEGAQDVAKKLEISVTTQTWPRRNKSLLLSYAMNWFGTRPVWRRNFTVRGAGPFNPGHHLGSQRAQQSANGGLHGAAAAAPGPPMGGGMGRQLRVLWNQLGIEMFTGR